MAFQNKEDFGFGPKKDEDTGTLLEVAAVTDKEKKCKLRNTPVHNLNEERIVGFINHEIGIRGKHHCQSASTKMVINKSVDLLVAVEPGEHYKYRKPAKEVKDIKLKWRTMVQSHQQDAYQEKDRIRLKDESTRYTLLEELKAENGRFTNREEIEQYFNSDAPNE